MQRIFDFPVLHGPLPSLSEGDSVGIVAWTQNTTANGLIQEHGEGFHIGHNPSDVVIPATVSKVEEDAIHLNDSRYQIKIGEGGRLYVANFSRYSGGTTWTSVGGDSNTAFSMPNDGNAYQILEVKRKQD